MSYRKTYNSSITVSGTVSVSYPASEHGGVTTAHWTHTEPVSIDVTVNTDPFERSIDHANNTVNLLTGAVVGMESVQCKAIADNAERISDRIISGFFNLVNSNISVQKAEVATGIQSKFGLLMQFAKELVQRHSRMEEDVARLKRHYAKLFQTLDEDCQKRIYQLDKVAFELNEEIHNNLIAEPYKSECTFGYSEIRETANSENGIALARIRKKVSDVIENISDSVKKSLDFEKSVKVLTENIVVDREQLAYMPVVYAVSKSLNDENKLKCQCFAPDIAGKDQAMQFVGNMVKQKANNEWCEYANDEFLKLENEFVKHAESYFANATEKGDQNDRIYQTTMAMWRQNRLFTISK